VLALAHLGYGMAAPPRLLSLFALLSLGVMAFRAIGLMVASVVNSTQEGNLVIQLLYMPMLFLSGATFPIAMLPRWAQVVAQFMPASYLVTGFQGIFFRQETLWQNRAPAAALVVTIALGLFVATRIFRWDKAEKVTAAAKLWLLAVLGPFILLGAWEAYTQEQIRRNEVLWRTLQRADVLLIRDARVVVGDGRTIERGSILIREGTIAQVFEGAAPDPDALRAEPIEAAGKTVLPGLIDAHVRLAGPGAIPAADADLDRASAAPPELAAYLYSGVTAVVSAGDAAGRLLALSGEIQSGGRIGAELIACGPAIAARGGVEFSFVTSPQDRDRLERAWTRQPASPDEARREVAATAGAGVDCVEIAIDGGPTPIAGGALDPVVVEAAAGEARARGLRVVIVTGDSAQVAEAVRLGADLVVHGAYRDPIPDDLLRELARRGTAYVPVLAALEALRHLAEGRPDLLDRSLVQQVTPGALISSTRAALERRRAAGESSEPFTTWLDVARDNLRRAHAAGVLLAAGSGAGTPLVFHGPALHRELRLWIEAGVPAATALRAATGNAARALGASGRLGLIAAGHPADLVIVDGNPLEDIAATERISLVVYKGERVERARILKGEP
jgi:imidazolonepropionase-like amidohydrolase